MNLNAPRAMKERAPNTLGAHLTDARLRAGYSQEVATRELGWSRTELTGYETGRKGEPRLARLIALADLYGCTLDELVGRVPGATRRPVAAPRHDGGDL